MYEMEIFVVLDVTKVVGAKTAKVGIETGGDRTPDLSHRKHTPNH